MSDDRCLVFDIETDGLLEKQGKKPRLTKMHCVAVQNFHTGEEVQFRPHELEAAVSYLGEADVLIGHNITGFDIPVIDRFFESDWRTSHRVIDTLKVGQMQFITDLRWRDMNLMKYNKTFPKELAGRHSLEAWGHRIGYQKDDFGKHTDWSTYSERMMKYCIQDVRVNTELLRWMLERKRGVRGMKWSWESFELESQFGYILDMQQRNGFGFNEDAAYKLVAPLRKQMEDIKTELHIHHCRGFDLPDGPNGGKFIPKRDNKTRGYTKGVPVWKTKWHDFNPGSAHHIIKYLQQAHQWEPQEFTKAGQPKTDAATLRDLPYPAIPLLTKYAIASKIVSMAYDGSQAWLQKVTPAGTIHGRVLATGTRTNRCSHKNPNVAQTPKVGKPYGEECRSMWRPTRHADGWVLVGADASGIELRMMAERMARFDDGEFIEVVLDGDPHTFMMEGTGIYIRNNQKTWTYAKIYGAGFVKLGMIILADWREALEQGLTDKPVPDLKAARGLGQSSQAQLMKKLPALSMLQKAAHRAYRRQWMYSYDGRLVWVNAKHSALNTVLQSDAATVMKKAAVILDEHLWQTYGPHGEEYGYCANIHDEWQIETKPEHAEDIGKLATASITEAGEAFNLRIPLAGEYKVGDTWAETH